VVATNFQASPITPGMPIELAFDRLLLPSSLKRQTFELQDLLGNYLQPSVAYDPVSRVVRLCTGDLQPDQSYRLTLQPPADGGDPNGLRAIDGALLDPTESNVLEFPVVAGTSPYTGVDACSAPATTPIDFCAQVMPIFTSKCGGSVCHSGPLPAAGLQMSTPQGIQRTAIGRVAQGSNTGARSTTEPAGRVFGVDMPIISTSNAPGDSWLVYKLLLAVPPACSSTPGAPACDASAPGVQQPRLAVPWSILSDDERTTLSNFVQGREMPFPADPSTTPGSAKEPLTADEMETVSLWILQGAVVPACAQ
jgi:hypothetical protein